MLCIFRSEYTNAPGLSSFKADGVEVISPALWAFCVSEARKRSEPRHKGKPIDNPTFNTGCKVNAPYLASLHCPYMYLDSLTQTCSARYKLLGI
jgi:hypothetical protein